MHEHIGQWLPEAKVASAQAPDAAPIIEVEYALSAKNIVGGVAKDVDDKQMLYCRWQHAESLGLVLGHIAFT